MRFWRVNIVDGLHRRDEGFAVAWATSAEEAESLVIEFLGSQTAYGKPFEVSEVIDQSEAHGPHVVTFNWGEWPDYPPKVEHPD